MATTYTLISSNVLTGSAASVTFSSIPSTYTDLVLQISARSDSTNNFDNINIQFNGVTTGIYSMTRLYGTGASALSDRLSNNTDNIYPAGYQSDAGATANTFGSTEIYIPNYTVAQNKSFGSFGASENNATGNRMGPTAMLFRSTAAITTITLTKTLGTNFVTNSSFYLYGIKNS